MNSRVNTLPARFRIMGIRIRSVSKIYVVCKKSNSSEESISGGKVWVTM